jgi:hypothetical protein
VADDRLNEAIDIVARNVVHNILVHDDNVLDEEWGDNYPEIGEHDWDRIKQRVREIGRNPLINPYNEETYAAAYEFLDARADAE